jgi:hypothetical protein
MINPSPGLNDEQACRQVPIAGRRRKWYVIVPVLLLIGSAALFDRLPALLITEERWDQADYVLVLGRDDCLVEAAHQYRSGRAAQVLLVARAPEPVVQLQILPPFDELARRKLSKAGVPLPAIEVIPASARNCWEIARAFERWFVVHPRAKIDVLSDRLLSSRDRFVLRSVLSPEQSARVRVFGLPDPEIVERGWWRHRNALKSVAAACLTFAFDYFQGPPPAMPWPSDPIAYAGVLE